MINKHKTEELEKQAILKELVEPKFERVFSKDLSTRLLRKNNNKQLHYNLE